MSHTLLTAILTRFGLLLLRLVTHLPFTAQVNIGKGIGHIAQRISRKWRTTAEKNITTAFPDLSTTEQQHLIQNHFESLGIGVIEMGNAWWAKNRPLQQRVTIEGLEHLDQAKKNGQGVILLSAHFTTLEIGGRLLSLFRPLYAMYRKQDNPLFNQAMVNGRRSFLQEIIEKKDVRSMLRLLKQGEMVWYAMDQNSSDPNAVFTEFFKVHCSTTTATSKLAQRSNALVIPFTTTRTVNHHYHLTIHPPLENFPSNSPVDDTQKIMNLFEQEICKAPEQYLWIHRRFKTRPTGEPPFY